jgi:hypothetical protein
MDLERIARCDEVPIDVVSVAIWFRRPIAEAI